MIWKQLNSPICIDISPIAQVALLHTDINSGFKFVPSMGIKSAVKKKGGGKSINLLTAYYQDQLQRQQQQWTYRCRVLRAGSKPW